MQPMDGGVIGSLKRRYRRFQIQGMLQFIDNDIRKIHEIDQLMAMKWVQTIREKMEPSIIYNSWHNTRINIRKSYFNFQVTSKSDKWTRTNRNEGNIVSIITDSITL